jgi:hypothetical protein
LRGGDLAIETQTRQQGGFANNFWVQIAALVSGRYRTRGEVYLVAPHDYQRPSRPRVTARRFGFVLEIDVQLLSGAVA